ncbi:hypothetical protein JXM67_02935 [candidate division WOR-3 bacterium]|nr:hypothetical protein [candidate division WOR-3 bacterium]
MRGINAVLIRKWLLQRFGEETFDKISSKISLEARNMLKNTVSNEWYPIALTTEIYKVIDDELSPEYPDVMKEYGRFSAEQSVKGFLRYLTRLLTVQQLTKRAQAFWKNYNKGGSIEAGAVTEENGRKKAIVTIRGLSTGDSGRKVLDGFLEVLISQTGVRNIEVKNKSGIPPRNKVLHWVVSWEE